MHISALLAAAVSARPRWRRSVDHSCRSGFTLTEMLVGVAIVLMLMSLTAAAINAARNASKISQTQVTISKIEQIIAEQLRRYDSRYIPDSTISGAELSFSSSDTAAQKRACYIRARLINGDMPDRWADVAWLDANGTTSSAQENYKALWNSRTVTPDDPDRDSAECLFMAIMLGGFADCLDCGPMRSAEIGDSDGDGLPEFLDAWDNPIGFLLWAPGLEIPQGTVFFSALEDPFSTPNPSPMLRMRPLIYSPGPDGIAGYIRINNATSSMSEGKNCGNPNIGITTQGKEDTSGYPGSTRDNITNFDQEARR